MKGWIYKIIYKNAKGGKNRFPGWCYIGQHRGTTIQTRFNGHKNAAKNFVHSGSNREDGKFANLHEAMALARVENFIIEELETFDLEDEHELITLLNSRETSLIAEYDSIENGWNAVNAPQSARAKRSTDVTLMQTANKEGVIYNSLRHRVNNLHESVEEAVKHLKEHGNNPSIVYEYKRQRFDNIGQLSKSKLHNREDVERKTLEVRIRKLKKNGYLEPEYNEERNENLFIVPDCVLRPARKHKEYSVETPDGDIITGVIVSLHKILLKRFPEHVPKAYTTVQVRIKKPNWNIQQAFGFDYPPDLMEVKPLIEDQGYKWAVTRPSFNRQNSKPVVLESKKEIFSSQGEFAKAYGLAEDLVSDHLSGGKTADEVLVYYELTG